MLGRTLGPYQVVAKLGEGGMGAVYRAKDMKLNRGRRDQGAGRSALAQSR
jgi:serine/threonine protein kinase